MLTRFKVSGFKNLVDVDIRFGPFTCIAGPNGVGKSNLFDALRFLSALAEGRTFLDAARSLDGGRGTEIDELFHRVGNRRDDRLRFEAEMIIPAEGTDDLGQKAAATITLVRYSLGLIARDGAGRGSSRKIEIEEERLDPIGVSRAKDHLLFRSGEDWLRASVTGKRGSPLISTDGTGDERVVVLHQDHGSGGRKTARTAVDLPRSLLSATNAVEHRTALLARREMQSWRVLQLEPSALRQADRFDAPARIESNGAGLAATLYRIAQSSGDEAGLYAKVANRLAELIDDVREVGVDRDEGWQLLTLFVKRRDSTEFPAGVLSDGALRFLALAIIDLDPRLDGVLCLEEPENGIHPTRVPAMLKLLQDIAVDPEMPSGLDNPLRQIIVNTHSPEVVQQVPEDALVIAEPREMLVDGRRFRSVRFSCLKGTWRTENVDANDRPSIVSPGKLLEYLVPVPRAAENAREEEFDEAPTARRVIDRGDVEIINDLMNCHT